MKSTSAVRDKPLSSIFASEPFLELRQMYFKGLRADRIHLVSLAASLIRCTDDVDTTLAQIRLIAHRMRGAAAIYEVPMVACTAAALEEAATPARHQDARQLVHRVHDALENLVDCIARLAGSSTA